ncbi:MAG: insulinase family protein [Prevotellaceae bacterium]|jgi:predicted Zn-dependent peptidase|nr:insulinase family protein [Prevotellaceae bacterium]
MSLRNQPPPIALPQTLRYVRPEVHKLDNGVALHVINTGSLNVLRVSLVFGAGSRFQQQRLVARTALYMLSEGGAAGLSGAQVAEQFDHAGASYELNIDKDFAMLTVYSLSQHLPKVLRTLSDVALHPAYDANALRTYCAKRKQRLSIDKQKVSYLAREQLLAQIYGHQHPYGSYAVPQDYDCIEREQLVAFHQQFYTAERCSIVAAGNISDEAVRQIIDSFSPLPASRNASNDAPFAHSEADNRPLLHIEKQGTVQSAIRVGCELFGKGHTDYAGMHVLSVILGGYFGSRLMRNLREEKGYTYGAYATMVNFQQAGHLSINAEVGKEFSRAALTEIFAEMQRLRDEPISDGELTLVRNHLCGDIMRSLDGAWALADTAVDDVQCRLAEPYILRFFDTVKTISSEQLQGLARKYLRPENMRCVIAG